ncbi:bifunctional adenosylcobinamide kinase/adenosylcobinamide-phosphate guanylyltransferase [Schinkia azotoformans]|uniref:Adenosylcobinamide kinase n=1 Tax=Schinkia azotoformans LMG 9581 TaxID=1131731 RepID=K6DU25_SCHAZ|nr:bifunctional adenosylcobinamide kinase/adenosylcobinamide-phosphate guanylyltransferase [Schinkia azotoformans]EKN64301.1 bifunctional adenosylcobalamin biosynthesis protein [Schinkia azotoformans LMG 9581]MEC1637990.1 bifunctional adenosylcobinamide kinase/adenosylcobinamide-phosphate guanylyltransferase [Schinkia azotoformans]MEC1944887.1 bifunctional adenosylcobinamide kinase/adenosylcobinamide-phosphate guanylyltransferase [Schinkia azotoformans]
MTITLVTGGVRSGKSRFAETQAKEVSPSVLYVAFGVSIDHEMEQRINKHQIRRPKEWGLLEEPYNLLNGIHSYQSYDCILVDSIETWVSNQCIRIPEDQLKNPEYLAAILQETKEWLVHISEINCSIIIVTSETGLGGVAMSPLGRFFQDVLGEINQLIAEQADEVYAVMSGIPLRIKPC